MKKEKGPEKLGSRKREEVNTNGDYKITQYRGIIIFWFLYWEFRGHHVYFSQSSNHQLLFIWQKNQAALVIVSLEGVKLI